MIDTNPGMLSTIKRRLCSFARMASSARFRSSRSVFVPYARFSAANRDSACAAVVVLGPSLGSEPTGRTALAASLCCILWSSLGRDSAELLTFSILGPGLRPVRRQDTLQKRRMPMVRAISFDDQLGL